jgi:hypothetical protein
MLDWFRRCKSESANDGLPKVKVYLNPLHAMLHAAEKSKGSALSEVEVLRVRDTTVAVDMTLEQAGRFYASLDAQVSVHRMNPDRVWEEWQEIRDIVN